MCMLKHSDNTISRRQEVGRGLRLAVNQHGDRQDNPATVHDINVLSVIASESYKDFVTNLQKEISESLSARPKKADKAYFLNKVIKTEQGNIVVDEDMSEAIEFYLIQNGYVDRHRHITDKYHQARKDNKLEPLPAEVLDHTEQVIQLINGIFSQAQLPDVGDDRKPKKNPLNANFEKREFKELWAKINRKAVYKVNFDSAELINNCVRTLNKELKVTPLQYTIQGGIQLSDVTDEQLRSGHGFKVSETETKTYNATANSAVRYDLVGKLAESCVLTRRTVAEILMRIEPVVFAQFKQNPEHFLAEAAKLIKEQKASVIIEKLSYDPTNQTYDIDIFTAEQKITDMTKAVSGVSKHIYDYVVVDSQGVERNFVTELDTSKEVVVYAKLPRGFLIPTPVGDYNPDWAISFKEGHVKHIYFIAETKGTMSSLELRGIEERKIECARKFFDKINAEIAGENVKYDVVTSYSKLMEVVGCSSNN